MFKRNKVIELDGSKKSTSKKLAKRAVVTVLTVVGAAATLNQVHNFLDANES